VRDGISIGTGGPGVSPLSAADWAAIHAILAARTAYSVTDVTKISDSQVVVWFASKSNFSKGYYAQLDKRDGKWFETKSHETDILP
jgi:hypothetical protein